MMRHVYHLHTLEYKRSENYLRFLIKPIIRDEDTYIQIYLLVLQYANKFRNPKP